jgi:hypothetical protein
MTYDQFIQSLRAPEPPHVSDALRVLWYDGADNWDQAHAIAQDMPGTDGSRLHAYLHRREGDLSNAAYWYRRAGVPYPEGQLLEEEWEMLVRHYLPAGER